MVALSQTKPSTPRLSEAARHLVVPDGIVTTGWPAVEAKAKDLGIEYDPWQQGAGRVVLGKRADGKYAATIGGVTLSIPRQVGKTFWVGSLVIVLCILFPGLKVLWTAHHGDTTANTFASMQGMCRRRKVWPHIKNRGIVTGNGKEKILFANGSRILFGARDFGFGRGLDAVDIEVFDEAQILKSKTLEDMVPATNQARHPHGALLFFIGTPPTPDNPGEEFTRRRAKAIEGKSRGAVYLEFSADDGADPDDHTQWRKANPSFPKRTPLDSMLRMRENLGSDEAWLREALGIWHSRASVSVINPDRWVGLRDPESRPDSPLAFAVDADYDRTHASIVLAARRTDGLAHIEVIESRPGSAWVPERLAELDRKWSPAAIVLDSGGPVGALLPAIGKAGVEPLLVSGREHAQACGAFLDATTNLALRHAGDPRLTAAVDEGRKRRFGTDESLWLWQRKGAGDITPLVAATLALHGLTTKGEIKQQSKAAYGF